MQSGPVPCGPARFFAYLSCMKTQRTSFTIKCLLPIGLVLALAAALSSCATAKPVLEPSVSIKLVHQKDVKSGVLGNNQQENPYMQPSSIIRKQEDEFVVLRLFVNVPEKADVSVKASVLQADGTQGAVLQTRESLQDFWTKWEGDPILNKNRSITLDQTYIPDTYFVAGKGRNDYYIVLIGKYPIPRPARVQAEVRVFGLPAYTFEAELPEPWKAGSLGLF